jgi:hypothetical protein
MSRHGGGAQSEDTPAFVTRHRHNGSAEYDHDARPRVQFRRLATILINRYRT